MMRFLLSRLGTTGASERVFRERLSEPLHLNAIAAFVAAFGSYRAKVYFDLAYRQYTAFNLMDAANRAATLGIKRISAIEFGVATGAGLLNICENASAVTRTTGVEIEVYGFDTGRAAPAPRLSGPSRIVSDGRLHHEFYGAGGKVALDCKAGYRRHCAYSSRFFVKWAIRAARIRFSGRRLLLEFG